MKRLFETNKLSAGLGSRSYSDRAVSLLLVFALLISMMPQMLLPAYSVENEQQNNTTTNNNNTPSIEEQYKANIGKYAEFSVYFPMPITDKPENVANVFGTETMKLFTEEVSDGFLLRIVDVYYNETHDLLWYKVEAAPGLVLPEKLQQYPWVFQDNVKNSFGAVSLILQETVEIPSISGDHGVTISAFNLPEGATVAVNIPKVNGEELPNVYDIKILKADGTEWQPIDEGKTVLISIPVEGDIANITHFVDYAPAIREDMVFESVEGADEEALTLMKDALDAYEEKFGTRDCVAIEEIKDVPIVDGLATFEASSFSLWGATGNVISQGALFINIGEGTDNGQVSGFAAAVFENGVWDNGLYYIPPEGGGVPEKGKIRLQAAWVDAATESYNRLGLFESASTNATVIVTKISPNGDMESKEESMTGAFTGEIYDQMSYGKRKRGMAYFDIDISNATENDRYLITVDDGNGNIATIEFIVADLDAVYSMTFTDPYGVLKEIPETINYSHKEQVEIPGPTAVEGYKFSHWILREPAGQWEDIEYKPGVKFQYKIGNVVFIPQVTPQYKYKIEFVSDVPADNVPSTIETSEWSSSDTYTAVWTHIPTTSDPYYTFMGWSVSTGGTLATDDTSVTVFGVPAGTATVTLTAVWKHNDDKQYTVEHYYQTLDADVYELGEIEYLYGIEDQMTSAKPNTTVGFTAKTFEQVKISGDSTVVKIYYTRNSYTATWNVDGATETESYKYGETIVLPDETPSKLGYVFDRWEGYTAGMTMPAANVNFQALWHLKTLAIYFETNGGTAIAPIQQPYQSKVSAPADPTKPGYIFAGWYMDASFDDKYEFTDSTTMPAESLTLYAKWTPVQYIVTFELEGGALPNGYADTLSFTVENAPTALPTPTRAGYTFGGWYADAECTGQPYTAATLMAELLGEPGEEVAKTLYAKWTAKTYTVTWVVDGKTTTETYEYGATPTFKGSTDKAADAQYTYTFTGWSPAITTVTGDATYTAQYSTTVNTYTVTWVVDGKTTTETYEYGATPVFKGNTNKAPDAQYTYTFTGWSPAITTVTGDATYTAQYSTTVKTYTVTWINWDGTVLEIDENVPYGTMPTFNGATPTRPENVQYTYTFANWSPTVSEVKGNVKYFATFTPHEREYTVKFVNYDGTVLQSGMVLYGRTPVYSGSTPVKPSTAEFDYRFIGWNPVIEAVGGDATYVAQFETVRRSYTVTWIVNGVTTTETYEYGTTPVFKGSTYKAPDVQYTYSFAGWTPEITTVTGDATYEAKFNQILNQYTVTWVDGFGNQLYAVTQDYGSALVYPANPAKEGYAFTGWDKSIVTVPGENVVITAQWTANSYTVQFNANGGTGTMANQSFTYDVTQALSKNAFTRTGYIFAGWNTAADGSGTSYNDLQAVKNLASANGATVTLYAKWTPITYKVHFNANGGTGSMADQSFTYDVTQALKPNGFSRDRYTFAGWNTAADGSGTSYTNMQAVQNLASTDGAEITLYAQWSSNRYTVTFTIIIQGEADTIVIEVEQGSDVLIAFAPVSDNLASVTVQNGTAAPQIVATNVKGYVFHEENIQSNVSIVIEAYNAVKTVVGTIDYGSIILESAAMTDGYLPYGSDYTLKFTVDTGYEVDNVTDSALTWSSGQQLIFSGTFTDGRTVVVDTKPIMYTITWVDGNGNVLKTEQVAYGEMPSYTGATPTKTPTAQYTYTFTGWSPAITTVTGDATYTAKFNETVNEYTITWVDGDGNVLKTERVAYGEMPSYTGATPTKTETDTIRYEFNGTWNPLIQQVTGDATYVAQFKEITKTASLTIQVSGGAGSVFVFKVSGDGMTDLYVTVVGGSSVTIQGLLIGKEYTVTEVSGWSWQYNVTPENTGVTIGTSGTAITFSANRNQSGWVGGEGSTTIKP